MICNNCDAYFDMPDTVKEPMDDDFNGQRSFMGYQVCPECGSLDIEETDRCVCGEIKRKKDDYCFGCLDITSKVISCAVTDIVEFLNISRPQAREMLRNYVEDNL